MRARLTPRFGEATDKLIDLYRKEMPNASPSQIYFLITAFPTAAITQAERKVAQGKAPVYMYLFTWETPVEGGKRHSPHTVELPFVFNNIADQPEEVGNGPELQPLAEKVSGAWTAFARTGNPDLQIRAIRYLGAMGGPENRQLLAEIYRGRVANHFRDQMGQKPARLLVA